jgi:hypothetical protein
MWRIYSNPDPHGKYLLQSTGSKDINSIRSAVRRNINLNKNLNKNKAKQKGPEKIKEFEISLFDFPQKQLLKRPLPHQIKISITYAFT